MTTERCRWRWLVLWVLAGLLLFTGVNSVVPHITTDAGDDLVFKAADAAVELRCVVGGGDDDLRATRWLYDGQLLDDGVNSTTLTVTRPGRYQCGAVTGRGGLVVSLPTHVQLEEAPVFYDTPTWSPAVVRRGRSARLDCGRVGGLPAPAIRITRNHIPLDVASDDAANTRFTLLPSGILQITNVQVFDEEIYLCFASNQAGNSSSRPAKLTTSAYDSTIPDDESALSLLAAPNTRTAKVGDSVLFECFSQRSDQVNTTWTRLDDVPISHGAERIHSNLLLKSISVSDQGLYMCKIDVPNHLPLFLNASLTVQAPPAITRPPIDVFKPQGHTARFECFSVGRPSPTFTWLKNGVPVKLGGRFKTVPAMSKPPSIVNQPNGERPYKRDLVVASLREADEGVYQCVIANAAGATTAYAHYVYRDGGAGEDDRIRDVVVGAVTPPIDISGETFHFQMTVPANVRRLPAVGRMTPARAIVLVDYHPTNTEEPGNTVSMECYFEDEDDGERCRASCCANTHFKPFKNYTFALRTLLSSQTAMSKPSEEFVVQSLDAVASTSISCAIEQLPDGVVKLEWLAPTDVEAFPGVIQQYRIQWRPTGAVNDVHTVQLPYVVLQHDITALTPNTSYEFRVVPSTRVGYPSAESLANDARYPWSQFTTAAFDPAAAERTIRSPRIATVVLNATSVRVSWSFEVLTQNLSGVQIAYSPVGNAGGAGGKKSIIVDGDATSVVISDLKAETVYRVTVNGIGATKERGLETSKNFRTAPVASTKAPPLFTPLLEPPMKVNCFTSAGGHASLHWERSLSSRNIVKYEVRLTPLAVDPKALINVSLVEFRETPSEYIKLDDLIPGRRYLVAVRSQDADGFTGPYSPDITCQSRENDLPLTWNFTYKSVNATTLLLVWSGDILESGSNYVIKYSAKPGAADEWTDVFVNGTEREYLLTNLVPGQLCFLKIGILSEDGEAGRFSAVIVAVAQNEGDKSSAAPTLITHTSYKEGLIIGLGIALLVLVGFYLILWCRIRNDSRPTARRDGCWRRWLHNRRPLHVTGTNGAHGNGKPVTAVTQNGDLSAAAPPPLELQTLLTSEAGGGGSATTSNGGGCATGRFLLDAKGGKHGAQPGGSTRAANGVISGTTQPTSEQKMKAVHVVIGNGDCIYGDFCAHNQPPVMIPPSAAAVSLRLGEMNSDPSHSPLTASSLHSWRSHGGVGGGDHSQPASSSLPNLTDSGIGFEEPHPHHQDHCSRTAGYPTGGYQLLSLRGKTSSPSQLHRRTAAALLNGGGSVDDHRHLPPRFGEDRHSNRLSTTST